MGGTESGRSSAHLGGLLNARNFASMRKPADPLHDDDIYLYLGTVYNGDGTIFTCSRM